MKTSQSQFDLMVTFMEQHGDLSKPSANARGRISRLSKWEELAHLLNSDDSGDTKTSEKWKKVWSDFKNNTKKKAARLHRAASGTAATYSKLTDLEQRVLNLTGVQVATSLAVGEAGLSQEIPNEPDSMNVEQGTPSLLTQQFIEFPLTSEVVIKTIAEPVPPSQTRAVSSPPLGFIEEKVQRSQPWNELGPSASYTAAVPPQARPATPLFTFVESQVEDPGMRSPTRPSTHVHEVRPGPALSGRTTPPRARPTQARGIQRKKVRPAHTKQAAQKFLQAEKFWRKFKIKQHRDYMDMRREQNRIREMEVQAQREWQKVGLRALEILDKLANKFCKD